MTQRENIRYLWIAGIVGPIIFLGGWVALSLLDPNHSFIADGGSLLGMEGARFPELWTVTLGIFGVSIVAFAGGLLMRFRNGWRSSIGIVLWFVVGIGGMITAIFKGQYSDIILLMIIDLMGFFGGVVAVPLMSWHFYVDDRYPGYHSRWTVVAVTILVVGTTVLFLGVEKILLGGDTAFGGIFQYPVNLVVAGWIAYTSFTLYRGEKRNSFELGTR